MRQMYPVALLPLVFRLKRLADVGAGLQPALLTDADIKDGKPGNRRGGGGALRSVHLGSESVV